jgi:hypothetical protein
MTLADSKQIITFLEPWGRNSWKVQYDGPYKNDRPPHVELGEANMGCVKAGDTFPLTNLHASGMKCRPAASNAPFGNAGNGAVMWDVEGLQNLRNPGRPQKAHFTVYFGPDAYGKMATLAHYKRDNKE